MLTVFLLVDVDVVVVVIFVVVGVGVVVVVIFKHFFPCLTFDFSSVQVVHLSVVAFFHLLCLSL